MTNVLMAVFTTLLAVAAVFGLVIALRRGPQHDDDRPPRLGTWIDRLERHTVVVHLTDGQSLRGVLVATYDDCVVLAAAAYLHSEGNTSVDGEAVLLRERVAWMQSLTLTVSGGDA